MNIKAAVLAALAAATVYSGGTRYIIDAGHGGDDGGAVAPDGTPESDINLSVCLKMDAIMGLFGVETVLTRTSGQVDYPPQAQTIRERKNADQQRRAELISSTENAVLISIHQNTYPTAQPHGIQVLYNKYPGSAEFAAYAQKLLSCIEGQSIRPAAEIQDSIFLMRSAECPAILVECGFLSNSDDLAKLNSDQYRTELAMVLSAACLGFGSGREDDYG